ncbi:hypothetical protein [Limosilactobacillus coleohominis]|uniref:hypothetical protein n=1 Tax=Limosilactobacillus coleohominis TaxID=181675 RepID=UPI0026EC0525|nr:hypothetical protein [Limosilactobacillus coleohominis]
MILPEIDVANYLADDNKLMQEMASLRKDKLNYAPVFTDTPNDTFIKASSAPWIRITPIPGDDAIYSDDARFFNYPRVQVDFWIRKEQMKHIEELQKQIYNTLHKHGFERYYKNRYPDPDLDGCYMVTANFEGFEMEE